jgi:hypothetical protein
MKPQTAISVVPSVRCAYRSAGRRRCRLSVSDPRSVFCPQHRSEQLEEEAADHFSYLSHNFQCFQTAQGINHSLHNLYALLAQNRISPRRAAVLSHICGLLLRTLPQIDADKAAGIFDPTKPVPINVAVRDEDADFDGDEDSDLDSDDEEESETESESDTVTLTDADVDPNSTNTWDPSVPETDPKKKPS